MLLRMGQIVNSGDSGRGAPLSFPKRKLSPMQRACVSLGLPVDVRPGTNLARRLRQVGLRTSATVEHLQLSPDEQARRIVELYSLLKNATERKAITIDHLIAAAGADAHHVWGVINEGLSRASEAEATLVACINAPDVTRKTIKFALLPGGHKDRALLLRIATVLSTPPPHPFQIPHRRPVEV